MQPSYEEKTEKFSMIRKKPHHVPPHLHNAIELVYVTKGELELGVGYELYHMEKGDFAVVFPDLIHHYQVFSKESNEVYQIYASLELSGPFMALLQKKCPENPVIKKENLPYEIKNSLECLISGEKVNEIVGQAYLQIILYQCNNMLQFIEKDRVGSNDLIYSVMTYLLSHFQEELTLTSVANHFGIGKYHLSRIFSNVLGIHFTAYLNALRMNYAKHLLHNSDMNITTIAIECGYHNQQTFNRIFKERNKCTPKEYKKSNFSENVPIIIH